MNNLQIFKSTEFGQVRTIEINGKIHFVASDVAKALGYKDPVSAISRHARGTAKHLIPTNGGNQEMNVIPEGDIYRLAAKSELPGADRFESWIFDEVLPTIRKTGGYIPIDKSDTEEDILAKAVLIAQKTIEKKNQIIADKDKLLEAQRPKVLFAEAVTASNTTILVGELAKILRQNGIDTGEKRLFAWLRNKGYLISRKGTDYNMPTQYSMELELFSIKETSVAHADGHITINKTPKVTGKGQVYFINKFKEQEEVKANELQAH